MNKVIYINNDGVFDINKNETLEIYHYVVDKNVNIKINLNGENAKVIYHLNIISNNNYNSNKKGYAYFNDLFMKRHSKVLY